MWFGNGAAVLRNIIHRIGMNQASILVWRACFRARTEGRLACMDAMPACASMRVRAHACLVAYVCAYQICVQLNVFGSSRGINHHAQEHFTTPLQYGDFGGELDASGQHAVQLGVMQLGLEFAVQESRDVVQAQSHVFVDHFVILAGLDHEHLSEAEGWARVYFCVLPTNFDAAS